MEDFLKVSFASRWKRKSEELEEKCAHLQGKLEKLNNTNAELNHHIDQKTKNDTKESQTDIEKVDEYIDQKTANNIEGNIEKLIIEIVTNKGGKYILKQNKLFTFDGKEMGNVTKTSLEH